MKVGIRQILPDAQILHVETGTRAKGRKFKRFTVNNRGVIFTFEDHQVHGAILTWTNSENNYCSKLFEYFAQESRRNIEKYHIKI